ncbi:MAG: pyridoxine 5'-phosphate synthase [Ignavibacteriae bacterium]|nr:pyridoxine 5'-phosphate synthase [Ignavibacteriota bacterium]
MRLCVNIDHVATLREARGGLEPDPVTAAHICELHGAEGIVCHLREDRRHINDRDLRLLRETVKTKLDLEMAITDEIIGICIETLPDLATFVPERRQELTTEGGLDVVSNAVEVATAIARLHEHDIEVSLFIDPLDAQIEAAAEAGADIIEIHTGEFANARSVEEQEMQLQKIRGAAAYAKTLGLGVNAGHGISYTNARAIAGVLEIDEVSIGHAILARALFVGLPRAVEEMARLVHA